MVALGVAVVACAVEVLHHVPPVVQEGVEEGGCPRSYPLLLHAHVQPHAMNQSAC